MNKILQSSTDFNRVRDGRNSPDAYFDFDLTNARDEFINIAGNSFYVDANPMDGNAVVYFQETDNLRGPTPFYVSPGFIARIPFTQVRIRNTAQPGKKIRVVYGVDTDFQPGSVSQVSFAGAVDVQPTLPTNGWNDASVLVANTPVTVFTPAANVNGAIVYSLQSNESYATAQNAAFVAKSSPPVSVVDGIIVCQALVFAVTAGQENQSVDMTVSRRIPAGLGLYYISSAVPSSTRLRSASYSFL